MSEPFGWWRHFFEPVSPSRHRCRSCGEEMDVRGGRPQVHLRDVHGPLSEKPVDLPSAALEAIAPKVGPLAEVEGQEVVDGALVAIEEELKGLTRQERLQNLLNLANDEDAAVRDRVAAETLIAKYMGWLDSPPEEDEDGLRLKHVERFRTAIERTQDVETRFIKSLQDRETRFWILRCLAHTMEDMEWAENALKMLREELEAPLRQPLKTPAARPT